MKRIRGILLSAALIVLPAPVVGNTLNASSLLKACTTAAMHWVDFCNGFFQAVHDYGVEVGDVCSPPGLQRKDLVELYTRTASRLIANNPFVGTQNGFVIGYSIIRDQYPCRR